MSNLPLTNWLGYLNSEIEFYQRTNSKKRTDLEFDWDWYNRNKSQSLRQSSIALLKILRLYELVKSIIQKTSRKQFALTDQE